MQKVTITGSTGFIGRHFLKKISKENFKINLLLRKRKVNDKKNITCIKFDLNNKYKDYFKKIGSPDNLVHFAWGGIPNYTSNLHLKDELNKQYLFLSKCIEGGLKNLLITGTCLEYADSQYILKENSLLSPATTYAKAKLKLYNKLIKLQKKYDFNLIWARIFYVYGLDVTHETIYSQLNREIDNNNNFFNMSPGNQVRDYISVEKLVEILLKLMKTNRNLNAINICSGKKLKLKQIVKKWINEKKSPIKLNLCYYPYNNYEPKVIYGSVRKLNKILSLNDNF